jgi:hypothetical protein
MTARPARTPTRILVCVNPISSLNKPCCGDRGGIALAEALEVGLKVAGCALAVERVVCLNRCHHGPSLRLAPGGDFILGRGAEEAAVLIAELARDYPAAATDTPTAPGPFAGGLFPGA